MKVSCFNLGFWTANSMTLQIILAANMTASAVFMVFQTQRLDPLELRWTNQKIEGK